MIARVAIALLGAVVITGTLLLAMNSVTSVFREGDGIKYFRISDVVTRQDDGRPERPAPVAPQPDLPEDDAELPDSRLPVEDAPRFDSGEGLPSGLSGPRIEAPEQGSAPD